MAENATSKPAAATILRKFAMSPSIVSSMRGCCDHFNTLSWGHD
jgi:hypothetical protein